MGVPYSKQVNYAVDQVTPLVGAGFDVLKTTKNIAVFLTVIQVLIGILLALILFAILGLIYSVNPDLELERQELVTPFMQWLASWVLEYGRIANWCLRVFLVLTTAGMGLFLWQGSISGHIALTEKEAIGEDAGLESEDKNEAEE